LSTACCGCLVIFIHVRSQILGQRSADRRFLVEMIALHGEQDGRQIARLNRQGDGVSASVLSQLKEYQVERKGQTLAFHEVVQPGRRKLGLTSPHRSQTLDKKVAAGQECTVNALYVNANSESEEKLCSICIDAFQEGDHVLELLCKHYYHRDCIRQWLTNHRNCPMCKRDLHEMYVVGGPAGTPHSAALGEHQNVGNTSVLSAAIDVDSIESEQASSGGDLAHTSPTGHHGEMVLSEERSDDFEGNMSQLDSNAII